jgi:hypothetical protein
MQMFRKAIDRWLFDEYRTDAESLALFRILFAGYVLVAELPVALWRPPSAAFSPPVSVAAFFTDYPSHGLIVALNAAVMLCACCLMIGFYTEASAVGLGLGGMLVNSFGFADGKIDEGLLVWVALVLAFSGWGSHFSVDQLRQRNRLDSSRHQAWLLATLAMLIGFALFTAGSAKMHGGWLNPRALGTRYHLFWDYFVFGRRTALAGWAFHSLPHWAWKCADWSTVCWEFGFVFTVFRRAWFRVWCAIGALFHFGVWQLFDIEISSNLIAYGAVVSWAGLWPSATERLRVLLQNSHQATRALLCAAPFVFATCSLLTFSPDFRVAISLAIAKVMLVSGLIFAIGYLTTSVRRAGSKTTAAPL